METYLEKRIGDFTKHFLDKILEEEDPENPYSDDFFIELARPVYDWELKRIQEEIKKQPIGDFLRVIEKRNEVIGSLDVLNNKEDARTFLESWFLNIDLEEDFLQDLVFKKWYDILSEISEDLGEIYINSFIDFSNKFNLRYSIRKTSRGNHVLQLRPEVIALEELISLKETHFDEYDKFSREFSNLLVEDDQHVYCKILTESSNLVEYTANIKAGVRGNTLNEALGKILPFPFPHEKAKESLSKIYAFYSDYKGIRHGGGSTGLRILEQKDAIHLSIITALFASYICK